MAFRRGEAPTSGVAALQRVGYHIGMRSYSRHEYGPDVPIGAAGSGGGRSEFDEDIGA